MATTTTRLGLRKPATTDLITVGTDLDANYDLIDLAVGYTVCTSITRPATPYSGQAIYETDTARTYVRSGAAWLLVSQPALTMCTSVTRPGSPLTGQTIYETDTQVTRVWSGTAWSTGDPVTIDVHCRGTTVTTSGVVELALIATNTLALLANSWYRVRFQGVGLMSSSTVERWAQRIRKNGVGGTQLTVEAISPATNASQPIGGLLEFMYPTTIAENSSFTGTIARLTSNLAGNTWASGTQDTYISCEYMCPNSGATSYITQV